MLHILRPGDQRRGAIATTEFEGGPYGTGFPFFVGSAAPGSSGPRLHRHPYAEVCIVRAGQAEMTVDGKELVAGPGDIIVVGPGASHRFRAIGDEWLDMVCIHASDRFIIEWLADR